MREQIIVKTMTKNWQTVNRQRAGPPTGNAFAPIVERRSGGMRRGLDDEERSEHILVYSNTLAMSWSSLVVTHVGTNHLLLCVQCVSVCMSVNNCFVE